jgi:hypothetical protein
VLDGVDRRDARRWGRETSLGGAIRPEGPAGRAMARRTRAATGVRRPRCVLRVGMWNMSWQSRERAEPSRAGQGGAPSRARSVHRPFRPRVECDVALLTRLPVTGRSGGAKYPVSGGPGAGGSACLRALSGHRSLRSVAPAMTSPRRIVRDRPPRTGRSRAAGAHHARAWVLAAALLGAATGFAFGAAILVGAPAVVGVGGAASTAGTRLDRPIAPPAAGVDTAGRDSPVAAVIAPALAGGRPAGVDLREAGS